MITDGEAKKAVENIMSSTRVIEKYCKDHDCADCQFHGEYDELTEEYVCDIRDLLDVKWYK
jgi:hypothetical protein